MRSGEEDECSYTRYALFLIVIKRLPMRLLLLKCMEARENRINREASFMARLKLLCNAQL
jgi:hypothetical protein